MLHPANWDNSLIKSNFVRLVCYIYIYTHNIYIYMSSGGEVVKCHSIGRHLAVHVVQEREDLQRSIDS